MILYECAIRLYELFSNSRVSDFTVVYSCMKYLVENVCIIGTVSLQRQTVKQHDLVRDPPCPDR